jgi:hypothetical protein
MQKQVAKIQIIYTDGSTKEITKGMACDVSTEHAQAEFCRCDVETDIKPLLRGMVMTLKEYEG